MKHFSLLFPLLFAALTHTAYSGDIKSGLAAYWSFDGCSLADSSGNGYDGLQTIGTTCTPGVSGNGRFFDGNTGFVDVGNKNIISNRDSVTFIAWVYLDPNPKDPFQAIITKWENSGGPQEWWFGIYEDAIHFTTQGYPCASYCPLRMSKFLNFKGDCWTMVGVILTGDRVQYVLNGVVVDEDKGNVYNFSSQNTSVRIGRQNPNNRPAGHYTGGLDELRIYRRALTSDDLLTLNNYYQTKVKVHYTFGDVPTVQPNTEVYFPLLVNSDDWAATPINDFTIEITYRSNWHYIPNLPPNVVLTPGNVTPAGWTLTYSDVLVDANFRKVTIRGTGAIPLTKSGIVANLKFGTLLPDTNKHTSTVTTQTFSSERGVCFTSDGIALTTTLADFSPPVISSGAGDCRTYTFEINDPERITALQLDLAASDNVDLSFSPSLPAASVTVTITLRDGALPGKFKLIAINSRGKTASEERALSGGSQLELQSDGTDIMRDTLVVGQMRCRTVEVVNPGNDTVQISRLFMQRNIEISLPGGGRADVIPPKWRLTVQVCYAPTRAGETNDTLHIESQCAFLKRPFTILGEPGLLFGNDRCSIGIEGEYFSRFEGVPYPNPATTFVAIVIQSSYRGIWLEDALGNNIPCKFDLQKGFTSTEVRFSTEELPTAWYGIVVKTATSNHRYPVFILR